jgi:peptidoglycan hydrolase-like amidase
MPQGCLVSHVSQSVSGVWKTPVPYLPGSKHQIDDSEGQAARVYSAEWAVRSSDLHSVEMLTSNSFRGYLLWSKVTDL